MPYSSVDWGVTINAELNDDGDANIDIDECISRILQFGTQGGAKFVNG